MANLRRYRKQSGFTQEKLAELCQTDPCYIRQIEIGRRFPSVQYIERMAKALNIAPHCLFYDEAAPENGAASSLSAEKMQKIKTLLMDNVSRICSIIDN